MVFLILVSSSIYIVYSEIFGLERQVVMLSERRRHGHQSALPAFSTFPVPEFKNPFCSIAQLDIEFSPTLFVVFAGLACRRILLARAEPSPRVLMIPCRPYPASRNVGRGSECPDLVSQCGYEPKLEEQYEQ